MISTQEIQLIQSDPAERICLAAPENSIEIGALSLPVSSTVLALSALHRRQAEELIGESLARHSFEDTLVRRIIGRPTAIARLDCTISGAGIDPYECDDRPAGLGVLHILTKRELGSGFSIAEKLQQHTAAISGASLVAYHPDCADANDDGLALDIVNDVNDIADNVAIVRGDPDLFADQQRYDSIAGKSVSTIRTEGDKNHQLGISKYDANLIQRGDDIPDRTKSFVVKPLQGRKARGVQVYLNPEDKKTYGGSGTVTYARASRDAVGKIVSEFKPPIASTYGNMILRITALVSENEVQIIGGVYVARNELIVHGASNAVAGLILLDVAAGRT